MRKRLLIMNGQCIVQVECEGAWVNDKLGKAGVLKSGIYNLYQAKAADKRQRYEGMVVYVDNSQLYQQVGKNFVVHDRGDFDKVPEAGTSKSIGYNAQGKASVTDAVETFGRRRSR